MRWPFRRRRPLYAATAAEVATFGRRVTALVLDANRHGYRCDDSDLERLYAAEIDRAARRIVGILEAHRGSGHDRVRAVPLTPDPGSEMRDPYLDG